jgi:Domain of unknown function (DUF4190)
LLYFLFLISIAKKARMTLVSSSSSAPSKVSNEPVVVVQAQPVVSDSARIQDLVTATQQQQQQQQQYQQSVNASKGGVDPNKKFVGAPLGTAPSTYQQQPDMRVSGKAIASLICAIVGLFVLGVVLGPVAICLAASATSDINRKPKELKGKCMATSGLVIGIIGFVGSVVFIILYTQASRAAASAESSSPYTYDYTTGNYGN